MSFLTTVHAPCNMVDNVLEHDAVVPQVLDMLANNGDYVELCPPFQQASFINVLIDHKCIFVVPVWENCDHLHIRSGVVLCFV